MLEISSGRSRLLFVELWNILHVETVIDSQQQGDKFVGPVNIGPAYHAKIAAPPGRTSGFARACFKMRSALFTVFSNSCRSSDVLARNKSVAPLSQWRITMSMGLILSTSSLFAVPKSSLVS